MKKEDKIAILDKCKSGTSIARVYLKYDSNYFYYYPNDVNEHFLLAQEENDFLLDGFHIRKISHITKVEMKDDLCQKINIWNGITKQVYNPHIDLSSWQSIFMSLRDFSGFLIIEDNINEQFAIGKIIKVNKRNLIFRQFGADGIWQEGTLTIPYSSITHVAWDTRYSNNWFDYLNHRNKDQQ